MHTVSLSTLPERFQPVVVDNHEDIEFSLYHHDGGPIFMEHPYDDWDEPRWTWLAEHQDRRLEQRRNLETVLKLSKNGCYLISVPKTEEYR